MFNNTTLSFDDNKILKKISIGYTNICSSVQDHRQKFSVFEIKHKFWTSSEALSSEAVLPEAENHEKLKTEAEVY